MSQNHLPSGFPIQNFAHTSYLTSPLTFCEAYLFIVNIYVLCTRQIFHDGKNSYFGLLAYDTVTEVSEEHAKDYFKDNMVTFRKKDWQPDCTESQPGRI